MSNVAMFFHNKFQEVWNIIIEKFENGGKKLAQKTGVIALHEFSRTQI